jgi:hypothetical protein
MQPASVRGARIVKRAGHHAGDALRHADPSSHR